MGEKSSNLQLPYILAAQAQKHVTHNEAISNLDILTQLTIEDKDENTPPANPLEGSCYIVANAALNEWLGKENQIAAWQDGAWAFYQPQEGWSAWVKDEAAQYVFDGTNWNELTQSGGGGSTNLNPATGGLLGVNATADTTNRFSINSPASLFNNEGNSHQLKINKNATGDTASVLFQTGFTGRAEFGLTGDDDFHMKVSPDGSTFHDGIVIDKDTGEVTLPNTSLGSSEEGTWTPALGNVKGGDLAGATSINPIYANYKKIGKLVFVECGFTVNGVSATAFTQKSSISVTGLPFIPTQNAGAIDNGGLSGFVYRSISGAVDSLLVGGCNTSGTMYMFVFYTGFLEAYLTDEFHVTLTYTTAN